MKLTYTIENIMTKEVVTVDVDETVAVAMQQMVAFEIGSVAITRQEEVIGIFTDRDVLKCFNSDFHSGGPVSYTHLTLPTTLPSCISRR